MPSVLHEVLVELLREHPKLIFALGAGAKLTDEDKVVVEDTDLGTAIPSVLKADCVARRARRDGYLGDGD